MSSFKKAVIDSRGVQELTIEFYTLLIKLPFFWAYAPQSKKTTPVKLELIHLITASVNCSQPWNKLQIDTSFADTIRIYDSPSKKGPILINIYTNMKANIETYVQLAFCGVYLNLREILSYYGDGWPKDNDRGCTGRVHERACLCCRWRCNWSIKGRTTNRW